MWKKEKSFKISYFERSIALFSNCVHPKKHIYDDIVGTKHSLSDTNLCIVNQTVLLTVIPLFIRDDTFGVYRTFYDHSHIVYDGSRAHHVPYVYDNDGVQG